MNIDLPMALLGGMSASTFMRRHWHKKPLLVRQAVPGMSPLLSRSALFDLAGQESVESRLVVKDDKGWRLRRGPFTRRQIPSLSQRTWTLLVQGVNLHHKAVNELMGQFRFVPEARLDDLMISYASDGGGVGPHFDSYDVFLLQAHGQRRWRIGRQKNLDLLPDMPVKILAQFEAEYDWVLEPGDMLYLPPRWAHDGVAVGECMTYSVGFRSPYAHELAAQMLQAVAEDCADPERPLMYRDADQSAVERPGEIPAALQAFAFDAVQRTLHDPMQLARALGETLSEPKSNVWFTSGQALNPAQALRLDPRTRMLYDDHHVFINGEAFRASGTDARLMHLLADQRELGAAEWKRASAGAKALMDEWAQTGWLRQESS